MPISPEKMKLYPGGSIRSPEWRAIRARIKARAGGACEQCGIKDGAFRNNNTGEVTNNPMQADTWHLADGDKVARIVCTVAHLDGKLIDHSDENLKFLCQRCHNRLDAKDRQANAAAARHRKAGQNDLFGRT